MSCSPLIPSSPWYETVCIWLLCFLFPLLCFWTRPGFMVSNVLPPSSKQSAKHPIWHIPCMDPSHFARSEGSIAVPWTPEQRNVSHSALLSRGRSMDSQFTFLSYLPWRSLWVVSRLLSSSIWEWRRIINSQLSPTPHSGSEREVLPVGATQRSTGLSLGSTITSTGGVGQPGHSFTCHGLHLLLLCSWELEEWNEAQRNHLWCGRDWQSALSLFPLHKTSITVGKLILLGSGKRGTINIASES